MEMSALHSNSKIFVAGHRGMVGQAVVRNLQKSGFTNLVLKSRQELDLTDAATVKLFFKTEQPEFVVLAAAKVGGILANSTFKTEFFLENIKIQNNVIESSANFGVKKLLFLGSSCIYPKLAPQPISEDSLLTSPLEPSNEPYALAKIAGLKLCSYYFSQYGKNFVSVMPTNLYGSCDNFHPEHSHVVPGLIRRFHEAKLANRSEVVVWGSGKPMREFLHVDDLADAIRILLQSYSSVDPINVGTGSDLTIRELVEKIKFVVGFNGKVSWDSSKPDGTPKKLLNISKITELGWSPKISLDDGLTETYEWFKENVTL